MVPLNYIFELTYSIDNVHILYITLFIAYTLVGVVASFFIGYVGTRGLFYIAEFYLTSLLLLTVVLLSYTLRYGVTLNLDLGTILISQDIQLTLLMSFDIVRLLGVGLIVVLTFIVLTFGIEYMTREAFAYHVISNLILFSACICCFIFANSIGLLFIF